MKSDGFDFNLEIDEDSESGDFFLSISDLMSGLLMLFSLLFITVQIQLNQRIQEIDRLKQQVSELQETIDRLPERIVKALEGKVGEESLFVDPKTGDVSIGDRILFDEGSAELTAAGRQFLKDFIPAYSQIIFSNSLLEDRIARIVIEGHTSSKGDERKNMELSLQRSLAVESYIFSTEFAFSEKQQLRQKILAAGRGEIDADPTQDRASDRKVIFRFQFRRQELPHSFSIKNLKG